MRARRLLGVLAGLVALLAAHPLHAAPTPEDHIVLGERAQQNENWAEAAAEFTAAFAGLDGPRQRGALGEHLVYEAVKAHDAAYRSSGKSHHLTEACELMRTLENMGDGALPTVELRAELERICTLADEHELAQQRGAQAHAPEDVASVIQPPASAPPANARRRDRVGIAVSVSGSLLTAGGIALVTWGSLLPRLARRALGERGGTAEQDAQFLEKADRDRTVMVTVGSVALSAGIGLVVWGALRLHARRGRKHRHHAFRWRPRIQTGAGAVRANAQ